MNWTIACFIMLAAVFVVAVIILIYNKRRLHVNTRTAILNQLRCKKEEIRSKIMHITYVIGLGKNKKLNKDQVLDIVENEYDELNKVYKEYKILKKQLTKEELKHEKEDYEKSIEGVGSLIASIKPKEDK